MSLRIASATLIVPDYDAGIAFYCDILGFELIEDPSAAANERWVQVRPGGGGVTLRLAKARNAEQTAAIGNQTGGRVAFFLETDDFAREYAAMLASGVHFLEEPRAEVYGMVAVFADPFGNRWDLIGPQP